MFVQPAARSSYRPRNARGYRPASRVLEVNGDLTYTIDLDQQVGTRAYLGTVRRHNHPERQTAPKTPAVLKLPVGSYHLQVKSGSVETDEETVEIHDGGISQRRYRPMTRRTLLALGAVGACRSVPQQPAVSSRSGA